MNITKCYNSYYRIGTSSCLFKRLKDVENFFYKLIDANMEEEKELTTEEEEKVAQDLEWADD